MKPISQRMQGKKRYAIPIAVIFASLMLLIVMAPAEKQIASYSPYSVTYTYSMTESGLSTEISSWHGTLDGTGFNRAPGGTYSFTSLADTSVSYSYGAVPGYSTPASGSISGDQTADGTYSGAPLAPTISGDSGSPNPSDSGQSVTLSTSGANFEDVNGGAYHWSVSGGSLSSATASNPTWSGGAGSYTISVYLSTDAGNSGTVSYTQTVNSDPTVSASANKTTTDINNPIGFAATGSGGTGTYAYTWYEEPSGGSYASFSTAQDPSYSFGTTGTYYVYVQLTDGAGYAVNSNTLTITVNSALSVSGVSSSRNPSDSGQSITFGVSPSGGTTPYSYTWYDNAAVVGSNSASYSVSLSGGSYSIYAVVSDAAGSKVQTSTLTQIVNPDPSLNILTSITPGTFYVYETQGYANITQYSTSVYNEFASYPLASSDMSLLTTGTWAGNNSGGDWGYAFGTSSYQGNSYNGKVVVPFPSPFSADNNNNGAVTSAAGYSAITLLYLSGSITFNIVSDDAMAVFYSTAGQTWTSVFGSSAWLSQGATGYSATVSFTAGWYYIAADWNNGGGGPGMSELALAPGSGATISTAGTPPPGNPTDTGVPTTFFASSFGGTGAYTYSWTSDGNTYTSPSFQQTFGASGVYDVGLTTTDSTGYSSSSSITETVNSDPTVSASSNVSAADINYPIEFSSSPSGGSGGYTYSWALNGNVISTTQDFSYSFTSSGSYTLTITITDSVGVSSSSSVSVTINPNPSVSVSASQNPTDVGNSVTFSSAESGGTGTITYSWLINGVQESTASQFSYSFTAQGTYYVNLTVTDSDGHTAAYSLTQVVNPDPSVTIHNSPAPTDVGISVNFTSTISGGTGPYSYSWTINGQTYTSQDVSYTFTAPGTFPVDLTVTDANGNQASYSINEVVNPDPAVSAQAQYTTVDQTINDTFFASITGGTGPYNYTWSLGSVVLNYSQTFHKDFSTVGTYTINLTVVDSLGKTASSQITISVIEKPSALIEGTNKTDISTTTYWEGYGSYGSAPYNYYWFINGVNTSSGLYLQYSFPQIGVYNITLLIDDSQGAKAYAYRNVTVVAKPTISVSESRSVTDIGIPVYFNSTITGGTPFYNYTWSISGIGFVGYQQNLIYSFNSQGDYNITVQVFDGAGNSASSTIAVRINAHPTVIVKAQYPNIDPNVTDVFNSNVSGGTPGYTYAWYVNGSLAGSGASLNYSFAKAGIYPILLMVEDSQGQSASYQMDITVVSYPSASIIASRTTLDANVSDTFRASGIGGIGPYSYEWIIAGHQYSGSSISHAFTTPGNYSVQLIISDAFGKDASAFTEISVFSDPQISVSWSGQPVVSKPFSLNANVTGGIAPYSISWIFPSGQHETGLSISHVFSSSGPDNFQVQVSDQGGFIQSKNFTIQVNLFVAVAANQTSGLAPLSVQFSSSVLGGSNYAYNWSYGNGQTSLLQDPTYTFAVGNYTVHFKVTSSNGAIGEKNMSIQSLPPPVFLTFSSNLNITQSFYFNATPNWDAAGPYNMTWSMPDGQTLTGLHVKYTFPVYNELNTVIATFSYGNGQSITQYLTVRMIPAIPIITFTPPSKIPLDTMLALNASAKAPDSSSFNFVWDINGSSYTGQSVPYYFAHTGNYTISVTVTDGLGASASMTRNIQVLSPGLNKSIVISYTKNVVGPMTYYTIEVQSLSGITAVEPLLGTTLLPITEINSTYTSAGEIAFFNVTLNQADYSAGTYPISVVVFNNNSQSNHITIPFSVSSQFSSSFSFANIISFFGGMSNFIIVLLTLGGLLIAWASLRRENNPDVLISSGTGKTIKVAGKRERGR